jgi:hypothetical protein
MAVDLNALRAAVIANQNRGDTLPTNPANQVVVDRDGNVKMGTEAKPGEVTTQVPQETFA